MHLIWKATSKRLEFFSSVVLINNLNFDTRWPGCRILFVAFCCEAMQLRKNQEKRNHSFSLFSAFLISFNEHTNVQHNWNQGSRSSGLDWFWTQNTGGVGLIWSLSVTSGGVQVGLLVLKNFAVHAEQLWLGHIGLLVVDKIWMQLQKNNLICLSILWACMFASCMALSCRRSWKKTHLPYKQKK